MITISEKEFKQLAAFVKSNYGIKLSQEKKSLVVGRLHKVLLEKNYNSFSEYYQNLISDTTGSAVMTLVNKLTTNHTFFMREAEHFNYFNDKILPYLSATVLNKDLRVWSAGCSTGEEPYTLAMIMADYFKNEKLGWDTKILATDISTKVLETAIKGVYPNEQIAALNHNWKNNYFRRINDENSILVDKIRNEVIFRRFNLMDLVFPFKKRFHVIFCRNVMIYFDSKTRKELVDRFYEFTEPGGYLFIGHSETLNRNETKYKYIMPAVYRKE